MRLVLVLMMLVERILELLGLLQRLCMGMRLEMKLGVGLVLGLLHVGRMQGLKGMGRGAAIRSERTNCVLQNRRRRLPSSFRRVRSVFRRFGRRYGLQLRQVRRGLVLCL